VNENPDQKAGAGAPGPLPAQVKHTRLGGVWLSLVLGAVVLVLLLVFILMNGQRVQIHLYGAHLTAPLGVALLLAAALGVLLVVVPGGGRIIQLKRAARRLHSERELLTARLEDTADVAGASAGEQEPDAPAGRAPAPPGQPDGRQPPPSPSQQPQPPGR
jgi:uncharacterized integral membrane protein